MVDSAHQVREEFRPLTAREREIIELLLSIDAAGVDELRRQIPFARAARWDCGCASFDIIVDRSCAPQSVMAGSPAVEAQSKERDDASRAFDLLLWLEDGWLAGVEIVDYVESHGDDSPDEIPPLSPGQSRAIGTDPSPGPASANVP